MNVTKTFDYGISKCRINQFVVPVESHVTINLFDEKIAFNEKTNRYGSVVGFTVKTDKDILFSRGSQEITKNSGEGVINFGSKILSLNETPQIFPFDTNSVKFQAISEPAKVEILEIFYSDIEV